LGQNCELLVSAPIIVITAAIAAIVFGQVNTN
jgi:hypothetical protein